MKLQETLTLEIAVTNLGDNFARERMPKCGSSLDTLPIDHINPTILLTFSLLFIWIIVMIVTA